MSGARVTSEAGISFSEPESEPLKILPILHPYQECGVGFGAAALPGTRIGAAGTSYSYPEHHL